MKRHVWLVTMNALIGFTVSGCGSINVKPPPGLDTGDVAGDTGKNDTSVQDLPDGTTPDPGGDIPPAQCKTHDDCRDMSGQGPCVVGRCDLDTGTCVRVMLAQGADCDDQDPCTNPDWCDNGDCVGRLKDCDDGNPCTADFCNEAGLCDVNPVTAECDDGNPCTRSDRCKDGNCIGIAVVCDDQDPCTDDSCDAAVGCVFNLRPGCKPCSGNTDCEDGNPCTQESCVQSRCEPGGALPDGEPCSPPDPCAAKAQCQLGQCVPVVLMACDDGNPCTKDSCLNGDCLHTPLSGPACDDGNPCTLNDSCSNGTCAGGKPVNCDDQDPCTNDDCVPSKAPCPGVASMPSDGYQCCHVGCTEPNPTCTSTGCYCGKGTCDPTTADHCNPLVLPPASPCQCGLGAACKLGSCCVKGQCKPGPCSLIPR